VRRDAAASEPEFLMYYSVNLYFKNGGGSCHIISIGDYNAAPKKEDFEAGLAELEKEDEPTLILLTDAIHLQPHDYYEICQTALAQCEKLGDRFAILDVENSNVDGFRNGIGNNHLKYGAAYHPYLQTSLAYQYEEAQVKIHGLDVSGSPGEASWQKTFGDNGIRVRYSGAAGTAPRVTISAGTAAEDIEFSINGRALTIDNVDEKTGDDIVAAWNTWRTANDPGGFAIDRNGNGSGKVTPVPQANLDPEEQPAQPTSANTLNDIKSTQTALYNQIKSAMNQQRVVLPPSPAVAGVYASVDRSRGVWKAPANVSLAAVIGPTVKITHEDQESLNIDPNAGKSINAIRSFNGKGTLIWGARTLAGNDNEWRYVSVRRLFNMIEESAQKATAFAVFEPNDATTWLKVKAMIESYLYSLWEQGALAGPTPQAAYFVNVGLGKTMTAQDVLAGRLIVEIGIAAVRPAEFIILRFTHKMQEA
jgi:uncharacterized protein